jgi:hypothetical protein
VTRRRSQVNFSQGREMGEPIWVRPWMEECCSRWCMLVESICHALWWEIIDYHNIYFLHN